MRAAILGWVLAASAAMGQGGPPLVTSAAWEPWYQGLLAQRLAECPFGRAQTYYFAQNGDDTTGQGTAASPWKSLAKAQAVLNANPAGGLALLFRRGDTWHETTGIDTDRPNVTIGDYGEGALPVLSAFETITAPALWTPAAGLPSTYFRQVDPPVMYVKEDDSFDAPYRKEFSAAQVDATEGSWWFDGSSGRLYIHPKQSTDPRTDGKPYELVRSRLSGVAVAGDGSRIQNIRALGWGMWPVTLQRHGIESRVSGSARAVIVGCESYYGCTHAMTHYSGQGGIATFVGCRAGLTMFLGGAETMFNTYAYEGGMQTIFEGCTATHGTLPGGDHAGRTGMGFYGHTNSGPGQYAGLTIFHNCRTRDTQWGCKAPSGFTDLPPAASLDQAQGFIVNEVFEGGTGTGDAFQIGPRHLARVNGRYLNIRPPPLQSGALAAWDAGGWSINCTFQLDLRDQTIDYFGLYNAPPGFPSAPRLWNCLVAITTRPGMWFGVDFDNPAQSTGAEVLNCVFSNSGGGTAVMNLGSTGRVGSNAYYGFEAGAVGPDPHPVFLAQPPTIDAAPACASPTSCAASPLPGGVVLEFDQTGAVQFRNDIGPLESPPCGNCDQSTTTPVLNVLDFNCFLNLFAAGDPRANCDGSTAPPALNVLDFNCFLNVFSAGCR